MPVEVFVEICRKGVELPEYARPGDAGVDVRAAEEMCIRDRDKAAFKGEAPEIKNMVPFAPFDFYIQRKLFMHNMGHATTAYLGFINNKTYIWESVKIPTVKPVSYTHLLKVMG